MTCDRSPQSRYGVGRCPGQTAPCSPCRAADRELPRADSGTDDQHRARADADVVGELREAIDQQREVGKVSCEAVDRESRQTRGGRPPRAPGRGPRGRSEKALALPRASPAGTWSPAGGPGSAVSARSVRAVEGSRCGRKSGPMSLAETLRRDRDAAAEGGVDPGQGRRKRRRLRRGNRTVAS
jgi:hypothetical protein